jgi:hypothetical protein
MATALKLPKGPSVDSKAREALEKAKGDWPKAAKLFRGWIDNDRGLYEALVLPMIDKAIWTAVRHAARDIREPIWERGKNPARFDWPDAKPDRAKKDGALAMVAETHLMMFPLQGGLVLGDATRSQVTESREMYGRFASGNLAKERWLALIEAKLKGDTKTVAMQLKEEDLRKLQAQALGAEL